MDVQPSLDGPTLSLRPLVESDLEGLYAAASDPLIWALHRVTNRHERSVFEPYFRVLLASGATLTVRDRESGRVIGCSRYYRAPDRPETVSIGFTFLARSHWGGAANGELKRLMVEHVFATEPEVWFHIHPENLRSQRATAKLGAVFVEQVDLDLGSGPMEMMCYRLSRADWERRASA